MQRSSYLAQALDLKKTDSGANVHILTSCDRGVFDYLEVVEGGLSSFPCSYSSTSSATRPAAKRPLNSSGKSVYSIVQSVFDLSVVFCRSVVECANQVIDLGRGISGRLGVSCEVMIAHAPSVLERLGPLG